MARNLPATVRRHTRSAVGGVPRGHDTLEPSDSEDEMEAESDLDNGDEEITSDGEDA